MIHESPRRKKDPLFFKMGLPDAYDLSLFQLIIEQNASKKP
jgi:hypothetical protein